MFPVPRIPRRPAVHRCAYPERKTGGRRPSAPAPSHLLPTPAGRSIFPRFVIAAPISAQEESLSVRRCKRDPLRPPHGLIVHIRDFCADGANIPHIRNRKNAAVQAADQKQVTQQIHQQMTARALQSGRKPPCQKGILFDSHNSAHCIRNGRCRFLG